MERDKTGDKMEKHGYYQALYHLQTFVIFSEVARFLIFVFLAILFMAQIETDPLKNFALLSTVNMEFLLCNQQVLEEYENNETAEIDEDILDSYYRCADNSLIVGILLIIPLIWAWMYIIVHMKKVRDSI